MTYRGRHFQAHCEKRTGDDNDVRQGMDRRRIVKMTGQ